MRIKIQKEDINTLISKNKIDVVKKIEMDNNIIYFKVKKSFLKISGKLEVLRVKDGDLYIKVNDVGIIGNLLMKLSKILLSNTVVDILHDSILKLSLKLEPIEINNNYCFIYFNEVDIKREGLSVDFYLIND